MSSSSSSAYPPGLSQNTRSDAPVNAKGQKLSGVIDDKRIYVGNLDPTIDEYTVLKLFSPFGKVTNLNFMFHWHGIKKGTPRGYCFLEYETKDQAYAAVKAMNRKSVKNRTLQVSHANMAPEHESTASKRKQVDSNRPTAFSVLKSGTLKGASTSEKIKAMERKLAQMAEPSTPPVQSAHHTLPTKPKGPAASRPSSSIRDGAQRRRPY